MVYTQHSSELTESLKAEIKENHLEEIQEIATKTRGNKICAFVGSGLSLPTMPPWEGVLKRLSEYLPSKIAKNKFEEYWKELPSSEENNDARADILLNIAQLISDKLEDDFPTRLYEIFSSYGSLPASVTKIIEYKFSNIITTNFDCFLELAAWDFDRKYNLRRTPLILYPSQKEFKLPSFTEKYHIAKIHGSIDSIDSIIFTKKKYNDFYSRARYLDYAQHGSQSQDKGQSKNNSAGTDYRPQYIYDMLNNKTLLFIGYSLSDPHIQKIIQILSSSQLEKHHYILAGLREGEEKPRSIENIKLKSIYYQVTNSDTDPDYSSGVSAFMDILLEEKDLSRKNPNSEDSLNKINTGF